MEVRTVLLAMTTSGIIGAVGEKILISFGKTELAQFTNIAGLCGIGISALALVGECLAKLAIL